MTNQPIETAQMRPITIEIPVSIAQKMAETFEGTLEDATLAGLRLLHGMGNPTYNKLQALAKQREMSVPKAMREAVNALETAITAGKPGSAAIGRPKINEARDMAIYTQVTQGKTYAEVASTFSVSLVRVGQIMAQQRAMRGINPREELLKRNEEILRRVAEGEGRLAIAASMNISRSVVDYLVSQSEASQPLPTRVLPAVKTPEQPAAIEETFKVKTPEVAEPTQQTQQTQPAEPTKPRYVMPA
ncbi:MAG: hypothetical protein ACKO0Z_28995, partial [Betaproteobacteria bacterium]